MPLIIKHMPLMLGIVILGLFRTIAYAGPAEERPLHLVP